MTFQTWQKAPATAAAVTCGGKEAQHPELECILEPTFATANALGVHIRGNKAYQVWCTNLISLFHSASPAFTCRITYYDSYIPMESKYPILMGNFQYNMYACIICSMGGLPLPRRRRRRLSRVAEVD
jgi:hypothetical protein